MNHPSLRFNASLKVPPAQLQKPRATLWVASLFLALTLSACSEQPAPKAEAPATPAPVVTAASESKAPESESCGKVSIANMNWQSAEVLANIDKIILEKAYGCEVELVPGDTVPTSTSMMEKGNPDIAPELWLSSVKEPIDKAVAEGRLHYAAKALMDGGVEGWWIPKYLADAHPEIKTIADALMHPELFPAPDDAKKGAVYGCPSGWACEITTKNAFKAWEGEKHNFVLVGPGSAAGLDGAIARAYERKAGWLGYYWAPTSILGKYAMVKLDAGVPFDKAEWTRCNSKADCADPKKTDYDRSEVVTVVTDKFKKAGGKAFNYLSARAWHNDTVNQLLAWMSDNQANGEDGAKHFLKNNADVWEKWLDAEAAAKVKAGL